MSIYVPKKQRGCDENMHIPTTHFPLWNKMNGICIGKNIDTFKLYPRRMAFYICSSKSAVKRSAKWLVANGWLEEIQAPMDGERGGGVYRVVHHTEWVRKRGLKDCPLRDFSLLEEVA